MGHLRFGTWVFSALGLGLGGAVGATPDVPPIGRVRQELRPLEFNAAPAFSIATQEFFPPRVCEAEVSAGKDRHGSGWRPSAHE